MRRSDTGMSKRKRTWLLATAALTMAASFDIMEITAIASGSTAGKTELSLGVSQMAPEAVSFEVPLYLTMCVAKENGTNTVIVPSESYSIRNPDGNIPMAVTGLKVARVDGSDWALVTDFTPDTTAKEIRLSIGDVPLPDLPVGSTRETEVKLTLKDSAFYNYQSKSYKRIGEADPANNSMPLAVEASVPPGYVPVDQASPTAQFRLVYTVSCIDGTGTVMDKDYEGPDRDDVVAVP